MTLTLYDSLLKLNSEIEPIDFSKIMPNTYSFLDTDILNVNLGDKAKSKNNEELYTGRTSSSKVVVFEADESDVGNIVDVEITKNNLWYLSGKIIR